MCQLGVENIIVADNIEKKRNYIATNLRAWLKSPHLGMISILTAGDKHFFRHLETIKAQTGIGLNLWGINPLEVTHFKAGFLGVPPDFQEERVDSHGAMKQLRYQSLRFRAMLQSPGYFNRSLWDTLSGEYYRSYNTKMDYFHIFDYWRWNEKQIDDTLLEYDWSGRPTRRQPGGSGRNGGFLQLRRTTRSQASPSTTPSGVIRFERETSRAMRL